MSGSFGPIAAAAPAIGMIAAFACLIGGVRLLRKQGDRTKGLLLVVMAVVLTANMLILYA